MQWSLLRHVGRPRSSISLTSNTSSSCPPLTPEGQLISASDFPPGSCVFTFLRSSVTSRSACCLCAVLSCQGLRTSSIQTGSKCDVLCCDLSETLESAAGRSSARSRVSGTDPDPVKCFRVPALLRKTRDDQNSSTLLIYLTFWQLDVTILEILNVVSDFWTLYIFYIEMV